MNVTTAVPRVEKITKLKNISIKSQSSRPEIYVNKQNESEVTTEQDVVREEMEKEVISDRGRQSKILAEYSETLKILNFTSSSKNLLARSAISVSSDEIDGDEELNSEALIIKVSAIQKLLCLYIVFFLLDFHGIVVCNFSNFSRSKVESLAVIFRVFLTMSVVKPDSQCQRF